MPIIHPHDNTTAAWSTSNPSNPYTVGTRFAVSSDQDVNGIRWYRGTTVPAGKPSRLAIYRGDGTLVVQKSSGIVDSGAIGWQLSRLDALVPLAAGTTYIAAMDWPAGEDWTWHPRASINAPPAPFLWDDDIRAYLFNSYGFPAAHDNTLAWGVDVEIGGTVTGGGGTGDPTLTGDLASWLSNNPDVQLHETDGLPWLSRAAIEVNRLALVAISNILGTPTTHPTVAEMEEAIENRLRTVVGPQVASIYRLTQDLTDAGAAKVASWLFGPIAGYTPPSGGGSAFFLGNGTAVSDAVADVQNQVRSLRVQQPLGGTGWTLDDETDFVGQIAWAVPADIYVLSFDPAAHPGGVVDVAGVPWCPRSGWWAILNGAQAGERGFIEFPEQQLGRGDVRLPGVLVQLTHGDAAHIQAWSRA